MQTQETETKSQDKSTNTLPYGMFPIPQEEIDRCGKDFFERMPEQK